MNPDMKATPQTAFRGRQPLERDHEGQASPERSALVRMRSKPTEIEAVQWTGAKESYEAMLDARMPVRCDGELTVLAGKDGAQKWVPVPVGHWVVRAAGVLNDHWPVDPDYCAAKYEPVA